MRSSLPKGSVVAWLLVACAIAVSIGGFLVVRWMTKTPDTTPLETKRPVVTVQVVKATNLTVSDALPLSGTVDARDRLQVASVVGGLKIEQVLAEEGDLVGQGQPLAILNTDISQAKLEQLQARRDQQVSLIAKARQPDRPLEVAQLDSAVSQAESVIQQERSNYRLVQAALLNAEANLTRYSNLYGQGAVAQTEQENRKLEVDRQKAQLQAADDRIEAAKFAAQQARERYQLARQGGRSEDIAVAEAQLREIDAQIEEVRVVISQGRIVAPANGWILKRQARLGDIATAGKVLFEIAKNSELELLGEIPEVRLAEVRVGQRVTVRHADKTTQGHVWKLSPLVNAENRNAQVRIALPSNSGLRPGMFAEASIELGDSSSIGVPMEAVRGEQGEYYVFLLEGDRAQRQDVSVKERRDGNALIGGGLKVGQEVITEGGGFLRDGDTVARP